jgi:hypothetical protein
MRYRALLSHCKWGILLASWPHNYKELCCHCDSKSKSVTCVKTHRTVHQKKKSAFLLLIYRESWAITIVCVTTRFAGWHRTVQRATPQSWEEQCGFSLAWHFLWQGWRASIQSRTLWKAYSKTGWSPTAEGHLASELSPGARALRTSSRLVWQAGAPQDAGRGGLHFFPLIV